MANEFLWEFSDPEARVVAFVHRQDVGVGSCEVASDFLPRAVNRLRCIPGNTSSLLKPREVHSKASVLEATGGLLPSQS